MAHVGKARTGAGGLEDAVRPKRRLSSKKQSKLGLQTPI
jgi:hypothetical protein